MEPSHGGNVSKGGQDVKSEGRVAQIEMHRYALHDKAPISQGFTEDERGRFIGLDGEQITIQSFVHIRSHCNAYSTAINLSIYGRTGIVL